MKSIKAVVLEKAGNQYTVLDHEGSFRTVKLNSKAEVGEEVDIVIRESSSFKNLRVWASVAAAMLLIISATLGWNLFLNPSQTSASVALLSIDINPSLELELDNQGKVIKPISKNDDAENLLNGLNLEGKSAEEALQIIIERSISLNYLTDNLSWVILGYSPLKQSSSEISTENLTTVVQQVAVKKGLTPQVAFFKISSAERANADKEGLTMGQYGLWETAKKSGVKVEKSTLKSKVDRNKLLEKQEVKDKLKEERKTIESPKDNKKENKPEKNISRNFSQGNLNELMLEDDEGLKYPRSLFKNKNVERFWYRFEDRNADKKEDKNKDTGKNQGNRSAPSGANQNKESEKKDRDQEIERSKSGLLKPKNS